MRIAGKSRRFLMLQGPHGPFFGQLAEALCARGHAVWRAGFNRGDAAFWKRSGYLPHHGRPEDWPSACAGHFDRLDITDLVLYGDSRPVHAEAVMLARRRGIRIHVFEEGYLRPYWITYEREGSNGNSRLMQIGITDILRASGAAGTCAAAAPCRWGDMNQHVFWGALYHFFVLALNGHYPHFRPHRAMTVGQEFRIHLRELLLTPFRRLERAMTWRRIRSAGAPLHTVLLQLHHDASVRAHSDVASEEAFISDCLDAFAAGAPAGHHLVFKAHPLQYHRLHQRRQVIAGAAAHGLRGRVHYLPGGPLAPLLDRSVSAVTINSTAGQQALWRGLPLRIFGRAIYGKPEIVSDQPLAAFFAAPRPPDHAAYLAFRQFLLETSQIPGGYYSRRGRAQLLGALPGRMLAPEGPYAALDAFSSRSDENLAVAE